MRNRRRVRYPLTAAQILLAAHACVQKSSIVHFIFEIRARKTRAEPLVKLNKIATLRKTVHFNVRECFVTLQTVSEFVKDSVLMFSNSHA